VPPNKQKTRARVGESLTTVGAWPVVRGCGLNCRFGYFSVTFVPYLGLLLGGSYPYLNDHYYVQRPL
jgi:hypothetical protein